MFLTVGGRNWFLVTFIVGVPVSNTTCLPTYRPFSQLSLSVLRLVFGCSRCLIFFGRRFSDESSLFSCHCENVSILGFTLLTVLLMSKQ